MNNYNGQAQNINQGNVQNVNTGSGQFFTGEVNVAGNLFTGSSINMAAPNAHKTLWDVVAGIGASHSAEQQCVRGSCLEGTREETLKIIHEWRVAKEQGLPICWVSGAAGVGKSAIAMTVAKSCEDEGLVCSFFFFRHDPKRNNPSALMLTIARGLTVAIPTLRRPINERISVDPGILEARMEDQFRELVIKPCLNRRWRRRMRDAAANLSLATREPNLVIIDGLDECNDAPTQLRILAAIADSYHQHPRSALRFLICSRSESWIRQAFIAEPLRDITKSIVLDNRFSPARDIERYLLHEFQGIRQSSEYAHIRFPEQWPSRKDLAYLLQHSDGQFVYVAMAVKFVKLPFFHPVDQLRIIIDNNPDHPSHQSPFHEIDCLYNIVLRGNPDHSKELILAILAAIVVLPLHLKFRPSPEFLELLFGLTSGEVAVKLRAMYSVLDIRDWQDEIRVYHTSFTDYLFDQTRSGEFYIDKSATHHSLAVRWLQALSRSKIGGYR
ncbi:hypothetical protein V5O48_017606 [Marasmius crinis-equi]|uniref:Nephrocystin 3-like N-terminal domain-containing protein n=1 Tax=Marasmius crinis-equi TaxID=585013 RepID=A0ABR3ENQ2_9AGAR